MADTSGRLLYTQEYVEDIADAIRALLASNDKHRVSEMASKLTDAKSNRVLFLRSYVSHVKKRNDIEPEGANNYSVFIFDSGKFVPFIFNNSQMIVQLRISSMFAYGALDITKSGITFTTSTTSAPALWYPSQKEFYLNGIEFNFTPKDFTNGTGYRSWGPASNHSMPFTGGMEWWNENTVAMFDGITLAHPAFYNIFKDGGFHNFLTEAAGITLKDLTRQCWYNLPMQPIGYDLSGGNGAIIFDEDAKILEDNTRTSSVGYLTSYGNNTNHSAVYRNGTLPNVGELYFHSYGIGDKEANCTFDDIGLPTNTARYGDYMMETKTVENPTESIFTHVPSIEGTYLIVTLQQPTEQMDVTFEIETDRDPIYSETFSTAAGTCVNVTYAKFLGDDEMRLYYDENLIGNGLIKTSIVRISGVNEFSLFYDSVLTNSSESMNLVKDKVLAVCIASSVEDAPSSQPDISIELSDDIHENQDVSDISYILSSMNTLNSQIKVFITENAENSILNVSSIGPFSASAVLLYSILG